MNTKLIGINGYKGSFHEEAAQKAFGNDVEIAPCMAFRELVEKLVCKKVDRAVMAIENTISGTILSNYDLIRNNKIQIIGETYLHIKQNLGAVKGASMDTLREVHSHYMALNQCRDFFEKYEYIRLVETPDTAWSMKKISEKGDVKLGAVGSMNAIGYYNLEVLAEGIETDKKNYTRFALLAREALSNQDAVKVSISIVLKHQQGALSNVLSLLHLLHVNLTKIESTPVLGKPFQYRFYLDFVLDDKVNYETIIEAITPLTDEITILGKYKPEHNIYQ